MKQRWIILVAGAVLAVLLAVGAWMSDQTPATPAENHTQKVAPQAMLQGMVLPA